MDASAAPTVAAAARAAGVPCALLAVGTLALLLQILVLNGGKLVYTLDDAYIHLALAENIARGTYGVNLGEASAPSSSILYPFLLAPFSRLALFEWIPLAIGFMASLATVALWSRIVGSALDRPRTGTPWLAPLLVTLLIPATNLLGVMFTGMEHSLQLLATALLIAGLVVERETGRVPWWLWLAVLLGPLIRYENLALSLPALAYLFIRGHRRPALGTLALVCLLVGGFSAFLVLSGLEILPTSVLLKAGVTGSAGGPDLLGGLVARLHLRQGALLALLFTSLAARAVGGAERADRQLAAWCAVAVLLHLAVGPFGYFERYELYVWSAALLTGIVVFRAPLRRLAAAGGPLRVLVGASVLTLVIAFPYVYVTVRTPLGSNNIYEQHYQMHRFATDFYDGPIAVTDLGWVAFRNDRYVLDLWGLALPQALEARTGGDDRYMAELAREHDVELAILYEAWYPNPPEGWRAVGTMRLGKARLTPAESSVTFYALDPSAEPGIRDRLGDFRATLPRGVELVMWP